MSLSPRQGMAGGRGDSAEIEADVDVHTELASSVSTPTTKQTHPNRLRSRTSTFSTPFTNPLPVVMSRENSSENLSGHSIVLSPPSNTHAPLFPENEAGPSRPRVARQPSKTFGISSPSPKRAAMGLANIRTSSYNAASLAPNSPHSPGGIEGAQNKRMGLKRRISTSVVSSPTVPEEGTGLGITGSDLYSAPNSAPPPSSSRPLSLSRARATSTSLVNPSSALVDSAPTIPVATSPIRPMTPLVSARPPPLNLPKPGLSIIPPSPEESPASIPPPSPSSRNLLERIYNGTETSLRQIVSVFRPSHDPIHPGYQRYRRGSDDDADSEKGLVGDEEYLDGEETASDQTTASTSGGAAGRELDGEKGRYWGIWASEEGPSGADQDGYFSLAPTPARRDSDIELDPMSGFASLPTPALSAHSLSRRRGSPTRNRMRGREGEGWLRGVISGWIGGGERGKTGMVLKELGWTLGVLILGFATSLGLALWLLKTLPITNLRHLPKSSTDLQLLSAEIKTYMNSSEVGWWHTVCVLTFVGCWKHAWSVPGAIVLNILVGSLLSPLPALALLTIITATGSLGSYSLSRPLAPLIAVLFPKPLSLVRAALAPSSAPPPTLNPAHSASTEEVTPIVLSSAIPADSTSGSSIWRRLLIMRAMGIVPWSGMNVACGVVGVDWRIFWLTTAAGSASWSYTTASIGDLLGRIAIPATGSGEIGGEGIEGESLTGMLRDPMLLAKLFLLTGLSLIPVLLKRSNKAKIEGIEVKGSVLEEKTSLVVDEVAPISPTSSVLAQSLTKFTPTPAMFDVLSFGRTIVRTGVGIVGNGARQVCIAAGRVGGR